MKKQFLEFLMQFLTDSRKELFYETVEKRTRYLTVVMEDLYQPHNASAVIRTSECFGIQDVHIIENKNKWTTSRDVERGSSKWINIYRYKNQENNTLDCLLKLKEKGYKLVATTPHTDVTLDTIPIDQPLAFIFGTEKAGVSKDVLNNTDFQIKIPMYGFTESFNISVAAAICLNTLRHRIQESDINWHLSSEEKIETMLMWCKKSLEHYKKYEREYLERFNS